MMTENQPSWVGNATTENFSLKKNQLDEAIELRGEWKESIDIDYWEGEDWQAAKLAPSADDARNNSEASGDHNDLHNYPKVVEDFADEYGFVREAEQDGDVVINQGMSIVDALKDEFDGPLKGFQGTWRNMVYAAEEEDDNFDKIVATNNGTQGFNATVFPAGKTNEAMHAGRITPEYASRTEELIPGNVENKEEYLEKHVEYLTAIADQSVGRSFNTPDNIRNGDLLINKSIEVNEAIDWDSVERFHWRLKDTDRENSPQITNEWAIDVEYEDDAGITREAITDRETSMYADEFEKLESVHSLYENEFLDFTEMVEDYREGANAASETIIEGIGDSTEYVASGNPMAAGLNLMNAQLKASTEAYKAMQD